MYGKPTILRTVATFPVYSAARLAFWSPCLHFLVVLQPRFFLVILSPLQSLVPETDLAPPQAERCQVADWNALIGVRMVPAKDMCLSALRLLCSSTPTPPLCLQTLSARATILGQQRVFSGFLRGWRCRLVNTSLRQRGAIGAGTNCDDFKVGTGHYGFAAFSITPKMSFLNLILCCASVVTAFFPRFEVVFVLLMGHFRSGLFKCFIWHLRSFSVILIIYLFGLF